MQKDKSEFKISFADGFETLKIKNSRTKHIQTINNLEVSITDKPSHLEINDYNFDGFADFALYHIDDGMGVYSIYQIFIFNPNTKQFKTLEFPSNFNPKCDMFCDVKIDKIKKTLESNCRGGARNHTDIWKYDKNKKLILFQTKSY
ncbi:XAC2610-related protein [Flavobacterium mesophilum]|uniref:XAC2610-related protein n=1 Tax=Flavobacterium mesophilum TaxID=3143495 RepID=UPI0031E0B6E8